MMKSMRIIFPLMLVLLIGGCATMPTGPSVMVLPAPDKPFEQFQAEDAVCRQFAYERIGGMTGQQAAQDSAVKSAVVGTILGAAAGAAIGSASGDMGAGAAIGGGAGLLYGSAVGSSYASGSYYQAQRRYDIAYMQCMYAKGNNVPGTTRRVRSVRRTAPPPPDLSTTPPDAPDPSDPSEDPQPRY